MLNTNTFLLLQAYEFIGHLVLSFGVAFVASLVFESPMMALEKALLKQKESKGRS